MDVLSAIGGALGSVFTGGLTGLLGIGVQRYFDMKNKQLDLQMLDRKNAHEIEMKKQDAAIMEQEWNARAKIAITEGESRVEVADAQAFSASYNEPARYSDGVKPNAAQGWVLVFMDLVRAMVRPVLTIYLVFLVTLMWFHARAEMDPALSGVEYFKLMTEIVDTVLYLCTTCCLWWFGTRNRGKNAKA